MRQILIVIALVTGCGPDGNSDSGVAADPGAHHKYSLQPRHGFTDLGGGFVQPSVFSSGGGGSGTVTSVICGTGMTGGTITSTGTCAVDFTGSSYAFFDEEFCSTSTADGLISFAATGTGASNGNITASQGHPCIVDMNAGTTATTGRAQWAALDVQQIQYGTGSGKWQWVFDVQVPTLSISTEQFAFLIGPSSTITTTVNPAAGFWLMYDRENVATAPTTGAGNTGNKDKWICRSGDASVYTEYVGDGTVVSDTGFTTVDEPVVGGTWYRLGILYDSTLGTPEVDYSVNGTVFCKITTHIPVTTGSSHRTGVFSAITLRGATVAANRDVLVDYAKALNFGLAR